MQKEYKYHKLNSSELPEKFNSIDPLPNTIYYRGGDLLTNLEKPTVAIVGSRKPTTYGREVTEMFTRALSSKGIIIVSGLALGIDSIAHKTCVESGGQTIAVLPCGPGLIYPSSHRSLAQRIIELDGNLLTEYPENTPAYKQNFIARNRIISGLADIVIVTEANERSGTLHTANFALSQGKTVMAVPGPITSPYSKGTNNLIKAGAIPLTEPSDIFFKLGMRESRPSEITANNQEEYTILTLLSQGVRDGQELLDRSHLVPQIFNQTLTMLEINGKIKALGNNQWTNQ